MSSTFVRLAAALACAAGHAFSTPVYAQERAPQDLSRSLSP
jgi:cytochrome c-type biogenesis protein CcmH/NrfG